VTKEQAEEAALSVERQLDGQEEAEPDALRRAVHALRAHWPMRSALEAGERLDAAFRSLRIDKASLVVDARSAVAAALALARKEP